MKQERLESLVVYKLPGLSEPNIVESSLLVAMFVVSELDFGIKEVSFLKRPSAVVRGIPANEFIKELL